MYNRKRRGWIKHIDFILIDFLCLEVSFAFGYFLRNRAMLDLENMVYVNILVALFFIEIAVSAVFSTFHNVLKRDNLVEFQYTVLQILLVFTGMSLYLFVVHDGGSVSRLSILYMSLIYIILGYGMRVLWKMHLQKTNKGTRGKSLVIVTVRSHLYEVIEGLVEKNYERFHFAGIALLDGDNVGGKIHGIDIVADRNTIITYLKSHWVDEVFFDLPYQVDIPSDIVDQVVEMGITVHTKLSRLSKKEKSIKDVERIGEYVVLTTSLSEASPVAAFVKRCIDIVGGLVGCLITVVLMLIFGPLIYISSPGPIFFKQKRIGYNGRVFEMYKFRSMYMDAEERKKQLLSQNKYDDGLMFKLEYDPRIIGCYRDESGRVHKGIGNIIRDWSIDEFPQFFNVLKGDMSLVGTRPPTLDEWQKYKPEYRVRMATKPGITGLWQVSGRSSIKDFCQVVALDKRYIETWSIGLDVKILLKTVYVVLARKGAM